MNKISKEEALHDLNAIRMTMKHQCEEVEYNAMLDEFETLELFINAPTLTADETTFEVFNNKKDTWETVEYKENIFDDYIIDGIVKYECDNDWRIRLSKPKSPTADESDNK